MIHRKPRRLLAAILAAVLIVSQTACTAQTGQGAPGAEKTSFGEDWLLNTYCYIQVFEEGREDLIREAFALARDLENLLSRTIETSDIGRFNASEEGCEVDWQTAALYPYCERAREMTAGRFDITVGALTELWNFSADEPRVPDADAIAEALKHVGKEGTFALEGSPLSGERGSGYAYRFVKTDPGVRLDLGAAAKGYIAGLTADWLLAQDISRAILNFGGNVVFLGEKADGSDWACGIEDPAEGGSHELIQDRGVVGLAHCRPGAVSGEQLDRVCVVTSGTYERCFEENGVTYHHVLDPATGYPVETDILSATVIGYDPAWCDVLSTCCLLLGSEKGLALIEHLEADLKAQGYEAVFILADGTILKTDGADFTEN